jgi:hypothetical protein
MQDEKPLKHACQLNPILLEAINEGLSTLCGSAATTILFFMKNQGTIKSASDIRDLEHFAERLEVVFGFGSRVIEAKILEILCRKLHVNQENNILDNSEFSKEVKKIFKHCNTELFLDPGTEKENVQELPNLTSIVT